MENQITIYVYNNLTTQCFDTLGMLHDQGVTGKSFSKQKDYTEKLTHERVSGCAVQCDFVFL